MSQFNHTLAGGLVAEEDKGASLPFRFAAVFHFPDLLSAIPLRDDASAVIRWDNDDSSGPFPSSDSSAVEDPPIFDLISVSRWAGRSLLLCPTPTQDPKPAFGDSLREASERFPGSRNPNWPAKLPGLLPAKQESLAAPSSNPGSAESGPRWGPGTRFTGIGGPPLP